MADIFVHLIAAMHAVAVVLAALWLFRRPYIVAYIGIEGVYLICRLVHEGVRPCKDVRVVFRKGDDPRWEEVKQNILYVTDEEEGRVGVFTGKMERTYKLTTAYEAANACAGFLPPLICEVSWKGWGKHRREKIYPLRTSDLAGLTYSSASGWDDFVNSNKHALKRITDRANRLLGKLGNTWVEDRAIESVEETAKDWVMVGSKNHPMHDFVFHNPDSPMFGQCPLKEGPMKKI